MPDQMTGKSEIARRLACLVGLAGMPVRASDEAIPYVTTDDWGKVLVADHEAIQIALTEGTVFRDPESGFLKARPPT